MSRALTRRKWLEFAAIDAAVCAASPAWLFARRAADGRDGRIRGIIREFERQGIHRTGTTVDRASAEWLRDRARQAGVAASLEPFPVQRVDIVTSVVAAGERRVDGIPLFDAAFTGGAGIAGRLGALGSDADIGVGEAIPNAAGTGPLGDARRAGRHRAIVCVTRGGEPGLCPSNADSFLEPFGPTVLQVGSEHASWLHDLADRGAEARLIADVKRTAVDAFNVVATISGADRTLPPLVVMTPRSGWYTCTSERGGGIVCWLELMRLLRDVKPARDIVFVASSGHELGHLGINAFVNRRPDIVSRSMAWIHLGANIGAARFPPGRQNTLQASDADMERMLAGAMASSGLTIDARAPRNRIPGGEAEVVHRGGGRYVSIIGGSLVFHNPSDRGPDVVDTRTVGRFVDAFAAVANVLARA